MKYSIALDDPNGNPLQDLNNYISFSIARSVNSLGEGTVVVPATVPINFWRKNMRLRIYRIVPGNSPQLVGRTVWFLRGWELDEDNRIWSLFIQDAMFILKRMLVAYSGETVYADKTIEEGNNDVADDLIKAYVRENGGSLTTDTDRVNSYITVDVDLSEGAATEKTASYANLLETCRALADDSAQQGTPLFFDFTWIDASKIFFFYTKATYLAKDRTQDGIVFSKVNGTLKEAKVTVDYREESNVAYVGGEGQGAGRLIATVIDDEASTSDPFARAELFADAREAIEDTVLEAEGRSALKKATPSSTLTGTIIDSPLARFGVHYNYGDQVYAEAGGLLFTAHVDAFSISLTAADQSETIDVKLKGVTS